jgi:hypothetical protein
MQLFINFCISIGMRNIILSLFVLSAILLSVQTTYAAPFGRVIGKEIREEAREELREERQEKKQNLFDRVKNFVRTKIRFDARITGTVASLGDSSMAVTGEDEKTYNVAITGETKLVLRFGGNGELGQFAVGNKVNVFGKFTNDEKTAIDAKLIRNVSIQKRWGAFFGEVSAKNSDNFVMKTIERGNQTVFFDSGTKFLNHLKGTIGYADVQIGNRVRIKGVWDKDLSQITEVDEVRVFPLKPTPTPTVTD